jgi:hypothetical protein
LITHQTLLKHLDGDLLVHHLVPGFVDNAHAAAPDFGDNPVLVLKYRTDVRILSHPHQQRTILGADHNGAKKLPFAHRALLYNVNALWLVWIQGFGTAKAKTGNIQSNPDRESGPLR